jgi:type III pantothenate kinase
LPRSAAKAAGRLLIQKRPQTPHEAAGRYGDGSRRAPVKLIALNVGNSTVAAALMENHSRVERLSIAAADEQGLDSLDDALRAMGGEDAAVAAASVNAPLLEKVERALSRPLKVAGRDFPLPIRNLCRCPELTGHDRLLDGLAAGILYGLPAIAVDFGTALTFNVVDREGSFLGGAIVPGLGLAARSLAAGCSQLPEVDVMKSPAVLGRDTGEAITSGLLHGYVGLVDHMVTMLRKETGPGCRTVATGGEAGLVVPESSTIETLDPDLTLRGISLAFERGLP